MLHDQLQFEIKVLTLKYKKAHLEEQIAGIKNEGARIRGKKDYSQRTPF